MSTVQETSQFTNSIGLYYHPEADKYVGAIDPNQADLMVNRGFKLVAEGEKAAKLSEAEIADILSKKEGQPTETAPAVSQDDLAADEEGAE